MDQADHPSCPDAGVQQTDQAWFWAEEWQAGEQEASQDIEAGRIEVFDSAIDFLASFSD